MLVFVHYQGSIDITDLIYDGYSKFSDLSQHQIDKLRIKHRLKVVQVRTKVIKLGLKVVQVRSRSNRTLHHFARVPRSSRA